MSGAVGESPSPAGLFIRFDTKGTVSNPANSNGSKEPQLDHELSLAIGQTPFGLGQIYDQTLVNTQ